MSHDSDNPGPYDDDASFWPHARLRETYEWFGSRFAVLKAPDGHLRSLGRHWDTMVTNNAGVTRGVGARKPLGVRLEYELADAAVVDVTTRRDDTGGASSRHHIWWTLVNYQLTLASRRGGMPWGDGHAPPHLVERIDPNKPSNNTATSSVIVDGVETAWIRITCPDIATEVPLTVVGGRHGPVLVAVAGPESWMTDITVGLWPGRS